MDDRPRFFYRAFADHRYLARDLAVGIRLAVDLAAAAHLRAHFLGKRINHAHTNAVQTAGNLVTAAAKLPARVEHRHNNFQRRLVHLRMHIHRNPAPFVAHRDRIVFFNGHLNDLAIARQRFVDRVVDDLVDEMVQPSAVRRTNVHPRTHTHRLQPFEHFDLLASVLGFNLRF